MAFNGSGVFNRVHDWTTDLTNTVPVTASRMDAEDDGFATGLGNTICRDGQSTTTARIPFAAGTSAAAGTTALVSYAQTNDLNTGMYFPAADQIGLVAGGTEIVTITATGITVTGTLTPTGQIVSSAGTVGAPGISFASDLDCGLYRIGANNIGLALNGAKVVDFLTTGVAVTGTFSSTGAATLSSTLAVTGDITVNTNKFTVTAASGNTVVAGTLAVTGAVTGSSTIAGTDITASGALSGATAAGNMVATQAETETATATDKLMTPGRAQFHPGVAKAWVKFTGATGAISVSHNIASVTRDSAGAYQVAISTDFSTANYVAVATVFHVSALVAFVSGATAGNASVNVVNFSSVATDPTSVMVVFYGDQ